MSRELSDDERRAIQELLDAMVESGWLIATARKGDMAAMEMEEDVIPLIRKLRELVRAFGEAGMNPMHRLFFFKFIAQDEFLKDDDVL